MLRRALPSTTRIPGRLAVLGLTALILGNRPLAAQDQEDSTRVGITYRNHRLEMRTADGNNLLTLQWRFQFRGATPRDGEETVAEELAATDQTSLRIRRARMKVGGHAYREWVQYYLEYDFPSSRLLDFRLTLGPPEAQVRIGQWKVNLNRERVQSSGEQEFVERSIVNRVFTLDRQAGVMLFGHLFAGTAADLRYYAGALTGTGAGNHENDDKALLWLGRLEWQPLGTDPGMSGGDLGRRTRPALTIAGAAATNRSEFTRFSGSGGGQLVGFSAGAPGQYRVNQAVLETAFKYRGVALQHESHWKQVEDRVEATTTDFDGTYVQAALFPSEFVHDLPEPLEVGARWAAVHGGRESPESEMHEVGGVANWYFAGHQNKLSLDVFRITIDDPTGHAERWRGRLQWDVSF